MFENVGSTEHRWRNEGHNWGELVGLAQTESRLKVLRVRQKSRRRTPEFLIVVQGILTAMYSDDVVASDSRGGVGHKNLIQDSWDLTKACSKYSN